MIQDIAPHKLWNQYRPQARPEEDSRILVFDPGDRNKVAAAERDGKLLFPTYAEFQRASQSAADGYKWNFIYLFSLDECSYFLAADFSVRKAGRAENVSARKPAVRGSCTYALKDGENTGDTGEYQAFSTSMKTSAKSIIEALPERFVFRSVRRLRKDGVGPKERIFALMTGYQLSNWYRDNRFCGTCAARTVHSQRERALICPRCGRTIYPRIVPAVIVGVTNGDEIVLTRYAARQMNFYALIAGFTEIGETLEETVQREVMEEVGLKIKNIRYYKSQPWGVVDDILAGFFCDVDGDTAIRMDQNELKEAVWVRRQDIEGQPDDYSLTNEMMMLFKAGEEPL